MVDTLTIEERSWNMGRVRSKNTKPELLVRSFLHRNGFRFRLHKNGLQGRPDIVLPKFQTVIFVHGCFWHRHKGCPDATTPKTRTDFWKKKFKDNTQRDRHATVALRKAGWKVIVIWECEIARPEILMNRLRIGLQQSSNKALDSDKK